MNTLFKTSFMLGLLLAPFWVQAQGSIQVVVRGYEDTKGQLQVAVFNSEETFTKKPYKAQKASIKPDSTQIVFEQIPAGWYTVAVYQDKNSNDELDKNMVGIPKEPYGFSNDAQNKLSAPKYDEAKFEVKQQPYTVRIRLD